EEYWECSRSINTGKVVMKKYSTANRLTLSLWKNVKAAKMPDQKAKTTWAGQGVDGGLGTSRIALLLVADVVDLPIFSSIFGSRLHRIKWCRQSGSTEQLYIE
ncbi:MAG: hypothetical protein LJE65_02360, partial [Desulfobacteraceae bacterium]|nr:hypothetical protein [Desulfobacteraceae bacterium]